MSRRATATAAVNYSVDQEGSSDTDLNGDENKPPRTKSAQPAKTSRKANNTKTLDTTSSKPKSTKTIRKNETKAPLQEILATQRSADEGADEFDLPASDGRAMSTPMTATKTRADAAADRPAKAASEKPAPSKTTTTKPNVKRGRKAKETLKKEEIPDTQHESVEGEVQASSNFGRTTAKGQMQPRPAKRERDVVPATQGDEMHVDDGDADAAVAEEKSSKPARSRKESPKVAGRKRGSSASDHGEDGREEGDAKRRLSDMTKRFSALESRYETLRDVGIKEAESNYDELKKTTDERQKAAENLVGRLRSELAAQSVIASESKDLKTQVSDFSAETEKLKAENEKLEATLKSAQAEMMALQAKLAATRAGSEQRILPGSAAKGLNAKGVLSADAQKMAVKEQLYGDLTGLIIRDVKRREDEEGKVDVYDCIQTGRNGTLRFHLAVPNPQPPGVPYGDAEVEYTPLLDPSNDRQLIELLPDYLTDEIVFPQREAQRFYGRINEFIMKSRPAEQPVINDVNEDEDVEAGEEPN